MAVHEPAEIHRLWVEAYNSGDIDALAALYEPGAAYVAEPGNVRQGTEAVRDILSGYFALDGKVKFDTRRVIGNDDLAILVSDWKLTYAGEDGSPVELSDTTTDVVRRQHDGTWLIAVDNPFGLA